MTRIKEMLNDPGSDSNSDLAAYRMRFPELFERVKSDMDGMSEDVFIPVYADGRMEGGFVEFFLNHPLAMEAAVRDKARLPPDTGLYDPCLQGHAMSLVGLCGCIDHVEGKAFVPSYDEAEKEAEASGYRTVVVLGDLRSLNDFDTRYVDKVRYMRVRDGNLPYCLDIRQFETLMFKTCGEIRALWNLRECSPEPLFVLGSVDSYMEGIALDSLKEHGIEPVFIEKEIVDELNSKGEARPPTLDDLIKKIEEKLGP